MKKLFLLAVLLMAILAIGCTRTVRVGGPIPPGLPPPDVRDDESPDGSTTLSIFNNTGVAIKIWKDGRWFCDINVNVLEPCKDVLIYYGRNYREYNYVAIGKMPDGSPAGTAEKRVRVRSYNYGRYTYSDTWRVSNLRPPR